MVSWSSGLVVGALAFMVSPHPILLFVLILGALRAWQVFRTPVPGYYDTPKEKRIAMGTAYVGLLAALIWLLDISAVQTEGLTQAQTFALELAPLVYGIGALRAKTAQQPVIRRPDPD